MSCANRSATAAVSSAALSVLFNFSLLSFLSELSSALLLQRSLYMLPLLRSLYTLPLLRSLYTLPLLSWLARILMHSRQLRSQPSLCGKHSHDSLLICGLFPHFEASCSMLNVLQTKHHGITVNIGTRPNATCFGKKNPISGSHNNTDSVNQNHDNLMTINKINRRDQNAGLANRHQACATQVSSLQTGLLGESQM